MDKRQVSKIDLLNLKPIALIISNSPERLKYYAVRDTRHTKHHISDHVVLHLRADIFFIVNHFHQSIDALFLEIILQRTSRCEMSG